jgi:hypothetical protein
VACRGAVYGSTHSVACVGRPGAWTAEEDNHLRCLVNGQENISSIKWSAVAADMSGRNSKQCRERWLNHLDPRVRRLSLSLSLSLFLSLPRSLGLVARA